MPRKTDLIAIKDPFFKKSAKLIPCQKERINDLYNKGSTIVILAAMFKVNRRTIDFIVHPENLAENRLRLKENGGAKIYYDKDVHKQRMAALRKHKKDLFTKNNQP